MHKQYMLVKIRLSQTDMIGKRSVLQHEIKQRRLRQACSAMNGPWRHQYIHKCYQMNIIYQYTLLVLGYTIILIAY